MNILDKIVAHKRLEVQAQKEKVSTKMLETSPYVQRQPLTVKNYFRNSNTSGIIAEIKRQSPSKGIINGNANPTEIAKGYQDAGVSAISVLTDNHFFGGSNNDLKLARQSATIPILRKDFIIDEYQILEARAIGADMILLIAAVLEPKRLFQLAKFAKSLGLSILMEVHNLEELERSLCPELDLVGVNNRDLTRFVVDINTSLHLLPHIPNDFVKISESGISKPETIITLREAGFDGFLIGECFMKTKNPVEAVHEFSSKIHGIVG